MKGLPLSALINSNNFDSYSPGLVESTRALVSQAIHNYYEHNIVRGCTDVNAENFDPNANVNDGSCKAIDSLFTFGGVYQTCSPVGYTPVNIAQGRMDKSS